MHYRYDRVIQLKLIMYWRDQLTLSLTHVHLYCLSFLCHSVTLSFMLKHVTHDTDTALNSHQHVVLSHGLVVNQMQTIMEIQARRNPVASGSDPSWTSYLTLCLVIYVYVG